MKIINNQILITGNVPSSKNSKVWTGKYLVWGKQAQKYLNDTKKEFQDNKEVFQNLIKDKTYPLNIEFTFIRKSKHKFDYPNPLQTIMDLMVKYNWIEDDNADIIKPFFGDYSYDKENPGVIIKVL